VGFCGDSPASGPRGLADSPTDLSPFAATQPGLGWLTLRQLRGRLSPHDLWHPPRHGSDASAGVGRNWRGGRGAKPAARGLPEWRPAGGHRPGRQSGPVSGVWRAADRKGQPGGHV